MNSSVRTAGVSPARVVHTVHTVQRLDVLNVEVGVDLSGSNGRVTEYLLRPHGHWAEGSCLGQKINRRR